MNDEALLRESAEELFEGAPCGYLTTDLDGVVLRVNRTFEEWTGHSRDALVGKERFQNLLSAGGRIYHETHYGPMLRMQGAVREIAVEFVRADGTRLPALINSTLQRDEQGEPRLIRTTVFDATERRLYEQELLLEKRRVQEVSQALQASLLSGALPAAPGLDIEVAYRPGVAELEIGGDWYDAFWIVPGARLALTVGDVVGRGIEAAAAMGQLRSAVRALALMELPPGALLEALDRYADQHGVGAMATLVYAELDMTSGELQYALAGHPPPLLAPRAGAPEFLWGGRSLPLGLGPGHKASRPQGAQPIPPGCRLLLYTDGLIERRTSSLPEDLDRLKAAAGAVADLELAAMKMHLMQDLPPRDHPDDVCLMLVAI